MRISFTLTLIIGLAACDDSEPGAPVDQGVEVDLGAEDLGAELDAVVDEGVLDRDATRDGGVDPPPPTNCEGEEAPYWGEIGPPDPADILSAGGGTPSLDVPPDWDSGLAALLAEAPAVQGAAAVDLPVTGAAVTATWGNALLDPRSHRQLWLGDGQAAIRVEFDPRDLSRMPLFNPRVGQRVSFTALEVQRVGGVPVVTNARDWALDEASSVVPVARRGPGALVDDSDVSRVVALSGTVTTPARGCGSGYLCQDLDYGAAEPITLRSHRPTPVGDCVDFTGPVSFFRGAQLDVNNPRWVRQPRTLEPPSPAPAATVIDLEAFAPGVIEWMACDLWDDPELECGRLAVPLDWAAPDGARIEIFVRRLPAIGPPVGALWLLSGGPGASGESWQRWSSARAMREAGYALYIPDHRGTGRSAPLPACDLGALPSCLEALVAPEAPTLSGYTITGAALDLRALIEATAEAGDRVIVHGASYGTAWLHRLLQIGSEHVTAGIANGPLPPVFRFLVQWRAAEVYDRVFAACVDDAACRAAWGSDPEASVRAALATVGRQGCVGLDALGLDEAATRQLLHVGLQHPRGPMLTLTALRRAARCSAGDLEALARFGEYIAAHWPGGGEINWPLYANVASHDLMERPLPVWAEAVRSGRTELATSGPYLMHYWMGRHWPRAPLDGWVPGQPMAMAEVSVPLLVLAGTSDFQTTLSMGEEYAQVAGGPHTWLVPVPGAHHVPWGYVWPSLEDRPGCLNQIALDFASAPSEAPDTACLDGAPDVLLEADPEVLLAAFGEDAPWGGDGAEKAGRGLEALSPERIERARAGYRGLESAPAW